ncbi:MAG TPA: PH domain-containing protein [Xanthobacteraceae bacterium]|nr:PH domain-containing protein [Xanthobacteraceae bacterium]
MSYVRNVLQPGETIRYTTTIHWIIYLPGLLLLVLSGLAYWMAFQPVTGSAYRVWLSIAGFMLACSAIALFVAWFRRWTTEMAVTNRRIIFKRGFIRRHTIEMNLDKVESVDVDQSLLGRIFDYGDILVRGVGVGIEPLKNIGSPIAFRNHVTAEPAQPGATP